MIIGTGAYVAGVGVSIMLIAVLFQLFLFKALFQRSELKFLVEVLVCVLVLLGAVLIGWGFCFESIEHHTFLTPAYFLAGVPFSC